MAGNEDWISEWRKQRGSSAPTPTDALTPAVADVADVPDGVDPTLGGGDIPAVTLELPIDGPQYPWCTTDQFDDCAGVGTYTDATRAWAIALASRLLWSRSGRRYGLAYRSRRPCSEWGNCRCGCCEYPDIRLPGPIAGIARIVVNGETLDPSLYGLNGRYRVERYDDESWPICNDRARSPFALPTAVCAETVDAETEESDCPEWITEFLDYSGYTDPTATHSLDVSSCVDWVAQAFIRDPDLAYDVLEEADCPAWVESYLTDNGLTILSGTCPYCTDADGNTRDDTGRRYVCSGGTTTGIIEGTTWTTACSCGTANLTTACSCAPHIVNTGCTQPELNVVTLNCSSDVPAWVLAAIESDPTLELGTGDTWERSDPTSFASKTRYQSNVASGPDLPALPSGTKQPDSAVPTYIVTRDRATADAVAAAEITTFTTDAWVIEYWQGREVPLEAQGLAALLASQLAATKCGATGCVGEGLRRVVRDGVTMEYVTAADIKKLGSFGINSVDQWIADVNPHGLQRAARVISPTARVLQRNRYRTLDDLAERLGFR